MFGSAYGSRGRGRPASAIRYPSNEVIVHVVTKKNKLAELLQRRITKRTSALQRRKRVMYPSLLPRATLPVSSSYPIAVQASSRELKMRLVNTCVFGFPSLATLVQLSSSLSCCSACVCLGPKEAQTRSSPKKCLQIRVPLAWDGHSSCLFKSI